MKGKKEEGDQRKVGKISYVKGTYREKSGKSEIYNTYIGLLGGDWLKTTADPA